MKAYKGQDFSDNVVSAQRLNDLVDLAVGHTMRAADLVSGLRMVGNAAQGAPSTGDSYLDADGKLRLYYGGVFNQLEFTPLIVTLNNGHSGTLTAGDVVVGDTAADFSITVSSSANNNARVVGPLAANVAAGSPAQVVIRGPARCLCDCVGGPFTAGAYVFGPTTGARQVVSLLDQDPTNTPNTFGSAYYAELLENSPAAGVTLLWCWVWR